MMNWYKIEGLILSKIGVFSYWYFGLLNYFPFLLFFSFCLIVVYIFDQSKYFHERKSTRIIRLSKISLIVYGAVVLAWIGVGLYDMVVHFYVQNSIPEERIAERLSFLVKPEIAAMEGLIKYFLTLVLPVLFLMRDEGLQSLSVIYSRSITFRKSIFLYIFYLSVILILTYLLLLMFNLPMSEKYFTLVSGFRGVGNHSAILSYIYLIIMVVMISVGEELLFRGLIYPFLRENIGITFALLAQSLMFSLYHQNNVTLFGIFFMIGVLLALLYQQTKSIYLPVAVHASLLILPFILSQPLF
jgi:membrane protease YdiL (CAAX protease family)